MEPCLINLNPDQLPDLIPISIVSGITALSVSTIYNRLKVNQFPEPVRISTRKIFWRKSDVLDFLSSCKAEKNPAAPTAGEKNQ